MGTPGFATPVLSGLLDAGHEVAGVYTRPDRRAGRGRRLLAPEMKSFAAERGLPVLQPPSLREEEAQRVLAALSPELMVVAAYGLLLPPAVLDIPPLHCLNIHPSLLPRHRGPSPVTAAIMEGNEETGVTVMRLDEGMDTGPIVAQRSARIGGEETGEALTARLFQMGAELLVDTLPAWSKGEIEPRPQDEALATVTPQSLQRGRRDRLVPAGDAHCQAGPCVPPVAGRVHDLGGPDSQGDRGSGAGGRRSRGARPGRLTGPGADGSRNRRRRPGAVAGAAGGQGSGRRSRVPCRPSGGRGVRPGPVTDGGTESPPLSRTGKAVYGPVTA